MEDTTDGADTTDTPTDTDTVISERGPLMPNLKPNPKPMLKLLLMLGTDITDTPDTTDTDIEDTTVWVDTMVDTTDTPTMPMDTVTSERDLLMPNPKPKPKLIPRPITDVTMVDITVIPTGATMDTDTAVDTTGDKL